jgi:hypothetical protein
MPSRIGGRASDGKRRAHVKNNDNSIGVLTAYLVKVDEVHNCERDYHCQQAETEDVADIVPGYARTSAFSILLVGTATSISLSIFRRYLVGHEIFFSQTAY